MDTVINCKFCLVIRDNVCCIISRYILVTVFLVRYFALQTKTSIRVYRTALAQSVASPPYNIFFKN